MKKITILSFVAAFMAAFSFTSCNTGGDSFSLPSLDQQQSMINMLGYTQVGGIVYYNENKDKAEDVLDTIPNTIAYITTRTNKDKNGNIQNYYGEVSFQFPTAIISKFVKDEKLAAKIAEMDPTTLKVNLIPYDYASQIFFANPYDLELGDIITTDKEYKSVTVKFYINDFNCLAGYETKKDNTKYFCFYMQAAVIYVDGKQTNLLQNYRFNSKDHAPVFKFTTDKKSN